LFNLVSEKQIGKNRNDWKWNEQEEDFKIITVDLDESLPLQGAIDLHTADIIHHARNYEKYLIKERRDDEEYKVTINSPTMETMLKYSKIDNKGNNFYL